MPIESMLISAAVGAVFVIFAGVLSWGERQTRQMNQQPSESQRTRRRSF